MANILERFKGAWSAFKDPVSMSRKPPANYSWNYSSSTKRPDSVRTSSSSARTFVNSLYTRISIDCAAIDIEHVLLDKLDRYYDTVRDYLNYILNEEANIDQSGRCFMQELVYTMLMEGVVAAVPTLTNVNVWENRQFQIKAMRVGIIKEWFPDKVRVEAYNDINGKIEQFLMPKYAVAIIESPLRHVTNDPTSNLKRLIEKLNLIDKIDSKSGDGKLDMIIQLPYSLKTEAKKEWAAQRKKDIEDQIYNSKLGIAYIDAAEKVTPINRSLENNLQTQIEYLTEQVYAQLGLTKAVFDGTANEQEMLNYYSRTIEPIMSFISLELRRKYLSKKDRSMGHDIMFFKDPFKLVPVEKIADLGDRMTRNEIMSSNEFRAILGYKPSDDPNADELRNKNLNMTPEQMQMQQQLQMQRMGMEDPNQQMDPNMMDPNQQMDPNMMDPNQQY